jgi:hypothetical protein
VKFARGPQAHQLDAGVREASSNLLPLLGRQANLYAVLVLRAKLHPLKPRLLTSLNERRNIPGCAPHVRDYT